MDSKYCSACMKKLLLSSFVKNASADPHSKVLSTCIACRDKSKKRRAAQPGPPIPSKRRAVRPAEAVTHLQSLIPPNPLESHPAVSALPLLESRSAVSILPPLESCSIVSILPPPLPGLLSILPPLQENALRTVYTAIYANTTSPRTAYASTTSTASYGFSSSRTMGLCPEFSCCNGSGQNGAL